MQYSQMPLQIKHCLPNFPTRREMFTITLKKLSFILMEEPMLHLFEDSSGPQK